MSGAYDSFLQAVTGRQWQKLGTQRRAGVCTPLFSVYSSESTGIGEFPDLALLAEWCAKTEMSILQLLPMNDTARRFTPYDAASTFALDPVYLRPSSLAGIEVQKFKNEIEKIRAAFPCGKKRVDYGIKQAKLDLFWEMFRSLPRPGGGFSKFCDENRFWLDDYAVYTAVKEQKNEAGWESWEEPLKRKDPEALRAAEALPRVPFHKWLQWQAFLQASAAKRACAEKKVYLMGDLPFLVSRDSADVWSKQEYFKLGRVAGAPPDAFFANGQRWGMPPYTWEKIEQNGYDYLVHKVRYAQHFYDLFRIDHVVGTFRLWTIAGDEPAESGGLNGQFDPADESKWEEQGRKILSAMIRNADMLPCAEDLGVVPECSNRVLKEFAVPGIDVQRWSKEWDTTYDFKNPSDYRVNSIAVISTHDTSSLKGWWEFEAGTVDEILFKRRCCEHGLDYEKLRDRLFDFSKSARGRLRWKDEVSRPEELAARLERQPHEVRALTALYLESYKEKEKFCRFLGLPDGPYSGGTFSVLIEAALRRSAEAASVFSIQLLQDLLSVSGGIDEDAWNFRINFPGTSGPQNWSLVMPWPLEKILKWPQNALIAELHAGSGRRREADN